MPCFNEADKNDLTPGHKVFQSAIPPASDALDKKVAYNYFPATDIVSAAIQVSTYTYTGADIWVFLWCNRYNGVNAWNKKPNLTPVPIVWYPSTTHECRVNYSTIAKANAATRVQVLYLLGKTNYADPWINNGGSLSDLILPTGTGGWRSDPAAVFTESPVVFGDETYRTCTDKVLIPDFKLADVPAGVNAAGIFLDYEPQDGRTETNTKNFLTLVASEIHSVGKKVGIWTNPLNAPSQQYTKLTSNNLPDILDAVDYLSVQLWNGNPEGSISASYQNQINLLGTMTTDDWEKIMITVELNLPTVDAQWIYNKMHESNSTHPKHVWFWRNGAVQGCPAACPTNTNNIIAYTLYNVSAANKP